MYSNTPENMENYELTEMQDMKFLERLNKQNLSKFELEDLMLS
jgi:hypothetical protein